MTNYLDRIDAPLLIYRWCVWSIFKLVGEPKSVSKPDRGAQTAPSSSLEKDINGSNLSSSGEIITQPVCALFWLRLTI